MTAFSCLSSVRSSLVISFSMLADMFAPGLGYVFNVLHCFGFVKP